MSTELKTKSSWHERHYAKNFDLDWRNVDDTMERISVHEISPAEFVRRFEEPYKPVVITGAQDHWPAKDKWTLEVLKPGC